MSNNVFTELIRVTSVGPYGVKVGNEYFRFGKKLAKFNWQADATYSVEYGVGKGKDGQPAKYINSVTDLNLGGSSVPALDPTINQAPPATPPVLDTRPRRAGFDKPLTEYDLRKDSQIGWQGLVQSSMAGVAPHVSGVDKLISESQRVAELQHAFINGKVDEAFSNKSA